MKIFKGSMLPNFDKLLFQYYYNQYIVYYFKWF